MHPQLVAVGETLVTVRTVVRVDAFMHHALVLPDTADFGEALVALAALERPLTRVGPDVRPEVRLLMERPAAVGAGVLPSSPRVQVPVPLHV